MGAFYKMLSRCKQGKRLQAIKKTSCGSLLSHGGLIWAWIHPVSHVFRSSTPPTRTASPLTNGMPSSLEQGLRGCDGSVRRARRSGAERRGRRCCDRRSRGWEWEWGRRGAAERGWGGWEDGPRGRGDIDVHPYHQAAAVVSRRAGGLLELGHREPCQGGVHAVRSVDVLDVCPTVRLPGASCGVVNLVFCDSLHSQTDVRVY